MSTEQRGSAQTGANLLRAGRNIALKVPPHQWDATVQFYRQTLGLPELTNFAPDVAFQFGANQLWIDRVATISQAELWLELVTDDTKAAARHLERAGVVRCDQIEQLPRGFDGFWIASPAAIVHLVNAADGTEA